MNRRELIKTLEYSALAYKKTPTHFANTTLTVIDDAKTDVQCYIRKEGHVLYITFRGTDSFVDLMHDLSFCKTEIPYDGTSPKIKVHSGFISAYKRESVRGAIHKMITPDVEKVIVCGHSYGGALTVLCAVDIEYNFPTMDVEAFLFGSPRVGNAEFRRSYNGRVFKTLRVENSNDMITRLPFWFMGFRHVGIKIHVGKPKNPLVFSFKDHKTQRYYKNAFMYFKP